MVLRSKRRDKLAYSLITIGSIAFLWLVASFFAPGLLSTIVFEDFNTYDDRFTAPYEVAENYIVPPGTRYYMGDATETLANPVDPRCKINTCNGVETSKDFYECPVYTRTWTERVKVVKKNGFGTYYPYGGWACPKGWSKTSDYLYCYQYQNQQKSETCGGATTGSCVGDQCIVSGSCSDREDRHGRFSIDWNNFFSLEEYKEDRNTTIGLNFINAFSDGTCTGTYNKKNSWAYYEDDLWKITANTGNGGNQECGYSTGSYVLPTKTGSTFTIKASSKVIASGGGCDRRISIDPIVTWEAKRDFKGQDLKIFYTCEGASFTESRSGKKRNHPSICRVTIGPKTYSIGQGEEQTIEMVSSRLDPNKAEIFINAQSVEVLDFDAETPLVVKFTATGGSPTMEVNFGSKIPLGCEQGPNQILVSQTLAGATDFSAYDLARVPLKFCADNPVIITSNEAGGSGADTGEIYAKLSAGEVLSIPEGDTWTLYYVADSTGITGGACEVAEAYSFETEGCIGIANICQPGIWDSSIGSCVVNPDALLNAKCGDNLRYDVQRDECVLDIAAAGICEFGQYSFATAKCFHETDNLECFERFEYNAERDACEADPLHFIACRVDEAFNPATGYCEDSEGNQNFVLTSAKQSCNELGGQVVQLSDGVSQCVVEPEVVEKEVIKEIKLDRGEVTRVGGVTLTDTILFMSLGALITTFSGFYLLRRKKR